RLSIVGSVTRNSRHQAVMLSMTSQVTRTPPFLPATGITGAPVGRHFWLAGSLTQPAGPLVWTPSNTRIALLPRSQIGLPLWPGQVSMVYFKWVGETSARRIFSECPHIVPFGLSQG